MKLSAFILWLFCLLCSFSLRAQELVPVKIEGKWGYINTAGEVVIPAIYDFAESFNGNLFARVQYQGRKALVSKSGKTTDIPAQSNIKVFKDSFLIFSENGQFGISDINFKTILPPEYDNIALFSRGRGSKRIELILLEKDSLYGIADYNGRILIEPLYHYIDYENNFFRVADSAGQNLYSFSSRKILPEQFDEIRFYRDYLLVRKNTVWGIYDTTGKIHEMPNWEKLTCVNPFFIILHKEDSTVAACMDNGKRVDLSDCDLFENSNFSYLKIRKNNRYGLLNTSGDWVLQPDFDDFYYLEGHYYVYSNTKCGVYDSTGKQVVDFNYHFIDVFENNTALVRLNGKWGLINAKGKEVIPTKYQSIDITDNTAKARQGEKIDMYTLTANGNVTDVTSFDNVITIDVAGGSTFTARSTSTVNTRNTVITAQGNWFYDTALKRWGLNGSDGKVLIPPAFHEIIHYDTSPHTIVIIRTKEYTVNLFGVPVIFFNKRGVVRDADGKMIVKPSMAYIGREVLNRNFGFARMLTVSGMFYSLTPRGPVGCSNCRFMDEMSNGYARVFVGKPSLIKIEYPDSNTLYFREIVNSLGGRLDYSFRSNWTHFAANFKNGHWVYVGGNGRQSHQKYGWAGNFHSGKAIVKYTEKYGIINNQLEFVTEPEHDSISYLPFSNQQYFISFRIRNMQGFIDTLGEPVTGFNYDAVGNFKQDRAWVMKYTGKAIEPSIYYYIDIKGYTVGPGSKFHKAGDYSEDWAPVMLNGKWGYLNTSGGYMDTLEYSKAGAFKNGFAWVKTRGGFAYINTSGEIITKERFTRVTDFAYGYAAAMPKGTKSKWVFIDEQGNRLGTELYKRLYPFDSLGYAVAGTGKKLGLMDKQGRFIIPEKYSEIKGPVDGYYLLKKKRKYFMVDINSPDKKEIKLGKYTFVKLFAGGTAIGIKDGRTYYISEGKPTVLYAHPLHRRYIYDGFIIAGTGRNMGVLSFDGDTLIPFIYSKLNYLGEGLFTCKTKSTSRMAVMGWDTAVIIKNLGEVRSFNNGLAAAFLNGKWGIINTRGIWVCEPKYDGVDNFTGTLARATLYTTKNIIDANGKVMVNDNFEKLEYEPHAKLYRVELGKRVGYMSSSGNWVWQLTE